MSNVFVHGIGAVSPAGWSVASMREALKRNEPLPTTELPRPGWTNGFKVRRVAPAQPRPAFLANPRLRRTSPVAQYTVAAVLEALGADRDRAAAGEFKLAVVLTVMSGPVNYSRRFYDEALRDPATASPLVFPETVFNSPASHLAAIVGTTAINYTLIGDPATFLQGLALGANWLTTGRVDGCVVVAAEECDWITCDAYRLFQRRIVLADGAGAVYLRRDKPAPNAVRLHAVTRPHLFLTTQSRRCAAKKMRADLAPLADRTALCDGTQLLPRLDAAENAAWDDWTGPRIAPKNVLGEALPAAVAWQCVAAIDALQNDDFDAVNVSVVGPIQQAIGAQFVK